MAGSHMIHLAFATENERAIGLAQPGRRFHQCIEHRLEFKLGAADDLEHIGGGGLLLQGLS